MTKILNFKEIDDLAKKFAKYVKPNTVIALNGDLGVGKTTFVQTFAKEFGIKKNIKSPTFNYVLEYTDGKFPFYHFDMYRISDPMEIYEIGYDEYIENDGVVMIEWASNIESELPENYIEIKFKHNDENSRKVEIRFLGNKELEKYVGFGN